MTNNLQSLNNFINAAEKSRKYPPATAQNLRLALKKIELELNEEEKASIDKLFENINQIFHVYYQKNTDTLTVSSIETYKSRVKKVITDYKKYGLDPTGMNSWNPKSILRKKINTAEKTNETHLNDHPLTPKQDDLSDVDKNATRFELLLRPDAKAVILLPSNVTKNEVSKIRKYIDFLDNIAIVDSTDSKDTNV